MIFNLKKPCAHCPFRKDTLKGWLGEARTKQITDDILNNNKTFSCHKTIRKEEIKESHCYGALVLVAKTQSHNNMLQIAERLGLYTPVTDLCPTVFDSQQDMINHHKE